MAVKIFMNKGGIASTNAFLAVDEATRQAVLFDAPDHTIEPLIQIAKKQKLDVVGLWLTHGHFDHIADHAVLTRHFPWTRLLIHPADEAKLLNAHRQWFPLPFDIAPRKPDGHVQEGQVLWIGENRVEVMHTPGHCPGHVSYYFPEQAKLIGGDLIIAGSVGRTDLPDSDHAQLIESVKRIMKLPGKTKLHPGHGEPEMLDEIRASNDYVREILGI